MSKPILTIEAFAEWVGRQPKEKEYDYSKPRECAVGQYAAFLGMDAYDACKALGGDRSPMNWANGAFHHALNPFRGAYTFGALHERLQAALAGENNG